MCGGLGFYTFDVPYGNPQFGRAVACDCKTEERRLTKLEELNTISNQVDSTSTFQSFVINRSGVDDGQKKELERALLFAEQIAKWPETSAFPRLPWLTLAGNYGTGKSHLGKAIWNYRQSPENGMAGALMVLVPDMLDYIRQAFNGNVDETADQRFETIRQIETVLILDDLGAESNSEWVESKLFQLFNWRYDHCLPTVVLTNVAFKDLEPRIADRLRDGISCKMTAPTYRGAV